MPPACALTRCCSPALSKHWPPRTPAAASRALNHYIKPQVLCIDELGYLPIDKFGADCLFQIISHRYERGATLITTP
jgi:DNA replication protein DnaC